MSKHDDRAAKLGNKAAMEGQSETGEPGKRQADWSAYSQEELTLPGAKLVTWLLRRARQQGLQMKGLADRLGVTHGYISQLRHGIREIPHISQGFVRACANYLQVPTVAVMIAADQITLQDFMFPGRCSAERLDDALCYIQTDPNWGPLLPASVHTLDEEVKAFIVTCYEQAAGVQLVWEARRLPRLIHDAQLAAILQEEQRRV